MTGKEKRLVQALDEPMPIVSEPFAAVAKRAGLDHNEVLDIIRAWKADGVIRRFGARLRHHAIGYSANGMSVWNVPPDRIEEAAAVMVSLPQVSHCYQRRTAPNWKYNLFAMIHGRYETEVKDVVEYIARATGIKDYDVLFSVRELKKTAPQYGDSCDAS